jgi:serine/threonine protein kinase
MSNDALAPDDEEAVRLLERNGEYRLAGEAWERLGRSLDAGRAYEMHLRFEPDDRVVRQRLAFALVRHRRLDAAIAILQAGLDAVDGRDDSELLALLVGVLAARGWDDAARDRLAALRRLEPSTPAELEAFLSVRFGGPRGLLEDAGEEAENLFAGRYRVVRELGRGATGRVLLAHDVLADVEVALKVLSVDGPRGRDALQRFVREANAAKALDHPNLVRVFEIDLSVPFFSMEWMRGGTLADRIERDGPLSVAVVKRLVHGLLEALSALHRRGIVHRDVKPANVFFDDAGNTKLGDLGAAHFVDLGVTMTGARIGTLATMAPEQLVAHARPGPAADFYALGAVLVFALTGQYPHAGPDFVEQHLHVEPRLPSELRPGLGDGFDGLVRRLLDKDPSARLSSAEAVRAALAAVAEDEDEGAAMPTPTPRTDRTSSAPEVPAERFAFETPAPGAVERAFDRWLERYVEVRRVASSEELERYRDLARTVRPQTQCVYAIDEARSCVLLEWLGPTSERERLPVD